jgi:hypothetical protein
MAQTKKASSGGSSLLLFFAFLIGGIIGYLAFKADVKPADKAVKLSKEFAKVDVIQDLYVYMESVPANQDSYESLGNFEINGDTTVINSKENVGQALSRLFSSGKETLSFDEKLSQMLENIKSNFPEATGVIFSDRLKRCEVIKFRE